MKVLLILSFILFWAGGSGAIFVYAEVMGASIRPDLLNIACSLTTAGKIERGE